MVEYARHSTSLTLFPALSSANVLSRYGSARGAGAALFCYSSSPESDDAAPSPDAVGSGDVEVYTVARTQIEFTEKVYAHAASRIILFSLGAFALTSGSA